MRDVTGEEERIVMAKYFTLAVIAGIIAVNMGWAGHPGAAGGLGVAAGLCVLAAAVVESRGAGRSQGG